MNLAMVSCASNIPQSDIRDHLGLYITSTPILQSHRRSCNRFGRTDLGRMPPSTSAPGPDFMDPQEPRISTEREGTVGASIIFNIPGAVSYLTHRPQNDVGNYFGNGRLPKQELLPTSLMKSMAEAFSSAYCMGRLSAAGQASFT